jgi:hypothetical protein
MINLLKFKTIPDIFTHNFEALCRWRPLMHNPHEMPDAARYFIAQQLDNPEAVSRLYANQPEHRTGVELAFPDDSVLVLPDQIFQGGEFQTQSALGDDASERLGELRCRIEVLTRQYWVQSLYERAAALLESLGSILRLRGLDDDYERKVQYLAEQLNRELARGFCDGGCQPHLARAWLEMVERGRELGFELEVSSEATAALL